MKSTIEIMKHIRFVIIPIILLFPLSTITPTNVLNNRLGKNDSTVIIDVYKILVL